MLRRGWRIHYKEKNLINLKKKRQKKINTHLLYSQASLCPWEPLYQNRPQISLPETSPVHLRSQATDLSR